MYKENDELRSRFEELHSCLEDSKTQLRGIIQNKTNVIPNIGVVENNIIKVLSKYK